MTGAEIAKYLIFVTYKCLGQRSKLLPDGLKNTEYFLFGDLQSNSWPKFPSQDDQQKALKWAEDEYCKILLQYADYETRSAAQKRDIRAPYFTHPPVQPESFGPAVQLDVLVNRRNIRKRNTNHV